MEGQNIIATLFSAILTCLAFPPLNLSWVAFVSLIPLLMTITALSARRQYIRLFLNGWIFSFIILLYYHRWFFELTVWVHIGWILLIWLGYSAYLALFSGVAVMLTGYLSRFFSIGLVFPAAWVTGEWLRALGPAGNPAGTLGYTQVYNFYMLQTASLGGLFFISFLVVVINYLLSILSLFLYRRFFPSPLPPENQRQFYIRAAGSAWVLVFLIVAIPGWSAFRQSQYGPTEYSRFPAIPVAVVQANHQQAAKLEQTQWNKMRQDYIYLSYNAIRQSNPAIIFWPETITPTLNLNNREFMRYITEFCRRHRAMIVFGTPTSKDGLYYNAMAAVSAEGVIPQYYTKAKLMPFGEYWPAKRLLQLVQLGDWVKGADYSAGTNIRPLDTPNYRIAGAICLESVYPWYLRNQTIQGADFLAVLVNNAWFFDSVAAAEHLSMSLMRAVENNRFLVQAANTGISGIVDNLGRVIEKSTQDEQEVLNGTLYYNLPRSIYSYTGDVIVYLSILFLAVCGFTGLMRARR